MKNLSQHITESFIAEGKFDYLNNYEFEYLGRKHQIQKIDNDGIIHTTDKKMFNMATLSANGINFPDKSASTKTAWNKNQKFVAISKTKYQSILKNAIKDAGSTEFAYDIAQSLIHDPEILSRLQWDYPSANSKMLLQRLQWDLESVI